MAGSLENRGKLRELIDKFQFDGVMDMKIWYICKDVYNFLLENIHRVFFGVPSMLLCFCVCIN